MPMNIFNVASEYYRHTDGSVLNVCIERIGSIYRVCTKDHTEVPTNEPTYHSEYVDAFHAHQTLMDVSVTESHSFITGDNSAFCCDHMNRPSVKVGASWI